MIRMLALYRRLLVLYPSEYRREHAEEMIAVFCLAQQDACGRSLRAGALFYARELGGLVKEALRQRLQQDEWDLLRRFDMRSGFRFPRPAILLMAVLFGSMVFAIEKMKAIAVQPFDPGAVPNWLVAFGRVFVMGAVFVCISGAIGYGVLFVVRRSGLHRFSSEHTRVERR